MCDAKNLSKLNARLIGRFLYSVTQTLGTVGSYAVSGIDVDTLPVLMIIMRTRSTTDIYTIVHGNVGVNELLTNLVQAVDVFQVRKYSQTLLVNSLFTFKEFVTKFFFLFAVKISILF